MEAIESRCGDGMICGTHVHRDLSKGWESGKKLRGGGSGTKIGEVPGEWGGVGDWGQAHALGW